MGLGKTYSTSYLADSNNNTGADGQVLISTATGINWSDGTDIIGGPYLPLAGGTVDGILIIDTDTGSQPFYITRSGATDQSLKIHVDDQNVVFESIQDETADDYGGFIFNMDAGTTEPYFDVSKNYSTLMRVDGSGNVGIGTTSPNAKLHIGPAPLVSGYTPDRSTLAISDTTNGGQLIIRGQSPRIWLDGTAGGNGEIYLDNTNLTFQSGNPSSLGSSTMYLKSDGNVGIGTTSPNTTLHVNSAAGDYIAKFSHTTATGYAPGSILLQAGQSTSRGQGLYHYNTEADEAWFTGVPYNVASNKWIVSNKPNQTTLNPDVAQLSYALLTIENSGNVGIGTTSPSQKLDVSGAVNSTDYRSTNTLYLTSDGDDSGSNPIIFRHSGSERMRISSAGNVGIGTTAPGYPLDIVGFANSSSGFRVTDGTIDNRMSWSSGNIGFFGTISNHPIAFNTNSIERMRINSAGNVGIGTTSASAQLTVSRNSASYTVNLADTNNRASLKLKSSTDSDGQLTVSQGVSSSQILQGSNAAGTATVNININPFGGNVGIGTTSPLGKLQVNEYTVASQGNQNIHGEVSIFANSGDESLFLGLKNSPYPNRGWAFNPVTNGVNSDLQIKEHGSSGVRMTIQTGGNVGIGTTSPGAKLDVVGDLKVSLGAIIGNVSTSSSPTNYESILRIKGKNNYNDGTTWYGDYGQIILHSNTNSTSGARRFMITNALDNTKFAIVRSVDADTDPSVNSTANSVNSGTADFVIDNTGNVGIGTTAPLSKLHINDGTNVNLKVGNVGGELQIKTTNDADTAYSPMVLRASEYNILSGNVGIGTTAPATRLSVSGDIGAYTSDWANTASGSRLLMKTYASTGDTYSLIQAQDVGGNSNNVLALQPYGDNVGIGTTAPSQKLHVAGNARVTGKYHDSNDNAGLEGQVLKTKVVEGTTTGTDWEFVTWTPDIWQVNPTTSALTAATTLVCDTVPVYEGTTQTSGAGAGAGEIRILDAGLYEINYSVAINVTDTNVSTRQVVALYLTAHPTNGSEVKIPGSLNSTYLRLPGTNQGGGTSFSNTAYYGVGANTDIALKIDWIDGSTKSVNIVEPFSIQNTISIRKIGEFVEPE